MSDERFLITGAHGCIGAWVVRQLVSEGSAVVSFDAGDDPYRFRLVMDDADAARVLHVRGDITDLASLEAALDEHTITNVIHLAALQVPFVRADPPLGARVNVVGTVNVFDAVARRASRMAPLVYASSIAAYDALEDATQTQPAMVGAPSTLYGVFKRANEGTATVYWHDRQVASVGLRPHTVFGPGRDQGLTSAPTAAMLAAAAGKPFHLPYGGRFQLQYAPDVARVFIAASRSNATGSTVHNLRGQLVSIQGLVSAIESAAPEVAGRISYEPHQLPFPEQVDSASLAQFHDVGRELPIAEAVLDAIARFRRLLALGLVVPADPTNVAVPSESR